MAEEFDTTQKPKVELIKQAKHPENTAENSGSQPEQDNSERRKVVVVKKKAVSASSASAPTPKKVSAKVVAVSSESKDEKTAPKDAESPETTTKPQKEVASEPKTGNDGATENKSNQRTHYPQTQRPAVVAGRVGGRPVGNQRSGSPQGDRGRPSGSPFPQRPAVVAGRVGGRSPNGAPYDNNRPSGYQGNRPQGSGGPQGNNGPQGSRPWTPRGPGGPGGAQGQGQRPPFGQGGPRPGGPRPGGFNGPRPGGFGGRPGGGPGRGTAPAPIIENKGPVKKSFKAKKPVYQKRDVEMEEKLLQQKKKSSRMLNPVPKSIDIMEVISVSELARKMNLKASDLIAKLMSMGMMVTINQQIDAETATILASEFGCEVHIVSLYDETVIETVNDCEGDLKPRPPVVTVMGHVDHGKTKLLDAIRSADVASGEFGGITQHIGAYMVDTEKGRVTFLDTPGHEAFTMMRARGAQVTDIVILVVAADDGVMPQTLEALNHAKEAKVPIIVAVNKIDKPEANIDRIKNQLSERGLMPEDWGGQTMFCEISALKRQGIDKLLDAVLLESEILELSSNWECNAEGRVLESKIDHGRGVVSTVLVQRGTLRVGDSFVAGVWPGKVRAIFNDKGVKIDEASPSMPVEVLGFEGIPNAGDPIQVVEDEKTARSISDKRQELKRFEDAKNVKKITLDNLFDTIHDGSMQELKVIIKGDVQGSVEAVRSSLEKLSTKEIRLNVIQALPGAINEGDVNLASASNAILIGFNVRPTPQAKLLADQEKVDIRKYNIIYKAVEEIQQAMEGMLTPDSKEETIGTVEIRNLFKISRVGTVAGCYVLSGIVKRSASVNVIRDSVVIHTGKISSLKRIKDDAREVASGYECGIMLEGFDALQVGDQFEVFEVVEVARKLTKG
jgi:translation initiation factor IF-2